PPRTRHSFPTRRSSDLSLLEKGPEARCVAVRRKAHDFVLIGVEVESEMQSDNGIKNADGVSSGDFPEFFEFAIMGMINRGALHFAHAVDDHNQAVVPPGAKIGACCVSQMV